MALTPNLIRSAGLQAEDFNPSTQSTPCGRSHATSCVTVGDSDEDGSPIKQEPSTSSRSAHNISRNQSSHHSNSMDPAVTSLNKKTRLLKAQSEWMLSSLKEEGSPAALGGPLGSLPTGASAVFGAGTPSRGGPSSSYGSYSRLSVVDEKELMHRYSTSSTLRQ